MKKYFIEYSKNQIYTCFDGEDKRLNFRFEHNGNEYLFTHLLHGDNKIDIALKRIFKLKDKSSNLCLLLSKIIEQFNIDPKRVTKDEFIYIILPEQDKDLKFGKEKSHSNHIFTDDKYYDRTYPGMMIYNRLKKKLPVINFNF